MRVKGMTYEGSGSVTYPCTILQKMTSRESARRESAIIATSRLCQA